MEEPLCMECGQSDVLNMFLGARRLESIEEFVDALDIKFLELSDHK